MPHIGIETRTRNNGLTVHRARVRSRGFDISAEFTVIEEAIAWRARTLLDIREGRAPSQPVRPEPATPPRRTPADAPTIETASRALIKGIKSNSIRTRNGSPFKQSVLFKYESMLRVHVFPAIGGDLLEDVTTARLQAFVNTLASEQSAETARKTLTALRVVFRQAVLDGLVPVTPCAGVHAPQDPEGEKPIRLLDVTEEDRILAAAKALDATHKRSRALPIIAVAFATGMRAGEILALRYGADSLDLDRGRITIGPRGNLSRFRGEDGRFPLIAPKTKGSRRHFEIPPSLLPILRQHRLATGVPADGEFVFSNAHGYPLCGSRVLYVDWRTVIDDAGINDPRPRFHDTRHAWAVNMLRSGELPQVIAKIGGWGDVGMLNKRYGVHVHDVEREAAGARLDAYREQVRREAREKAEAAKAS